MYQKNINFYFQMLWFISVLFHSAFYCHLSSILPLFSLFFFLGVFLFLLVCSYFYPNFLADLPLCSISYRQPLSTPVHIKWDQAAEKEKGRDMIWGIEFLANPYHNPNHIWSEELDTFQDQAAEKEKDRYDLRNCKSVHLKRDRASEQKRKRERYDLRNRILCKSNNERSLSYPLPIIYYGNFHLL